MSFIVGRRRTQHEGSRGCGGLVGEMMKDGPGTRKRRILAGRSLGPPAFGATIGWNHDTEEDGRMGTRLLERQRRPIGPKSARSRRWRRQTSRLGTGARTHGEWGYQGRVPRLATGHCQYSELPAWPGTIQVPVTVGTQRFLAFADDDDDGTVIYDTFSLGDIEIGSNYLACRRN